MLSMFSFFVYGFMRRSQIDVVASETDLHFAETASKVGRSRCRRRNPSVTPLSPDGSSICHLPNSHIDVRKGDTGGWGGGSRVLFLGQVTLGEFEGLRVVSTCKRGPRR